MPKVLLMATEARSFCFPKRGVRGASPVRRFWESAKAFMLPRFRFQLSAFLSVWFIVTLRWSDIVIRVWFVTSYTEKTYTGASKGRFHILQWWRSQMQHDTYGAKKNRKTKIRRPEFSIRSCSTISMCQTTLHTGELCWNCTISVITVSKKWMFYHGFQMFNSGHQPRRPPRYSASCKQP